MRRIARLLVFGPYECGSNPEFIGPRPAFAIKIRYYLVGIYRSVLYRKDYFGGRPSRKNVATVFIDLLIMLIQLSIQLLRSVSNFTIQIIP